MLLLVFFFELPNRGWQVYENGVTDTVAILAQGTFPGRSDSLTLLIRVRILEFDFFPFWPLNCINLVNKPVDIVTVAILAQGTLSG